MLSLSPSLDSGGFNVLMLIPDTYSIHPILEKSVRRGTRMDEWKY